MGFQPRDTGTIEQRFGFLKLNLTYRPFFAKAYTVTRSLLLTFVLIVKIKILCFMIQKSRIRNRAVKQSLNTRRLIPAYRGPQGMTTSIGSP